MKTKPGVIRPAPVKSKILLKKEEEVYEPNPFSKYLEDNSDFFSEQVSVHMKVFDIWINNYKCRCPMNKVCKKM